MAACRLVNFPLVKLSLNCRASNMAIFTPSPANGGIQWAASPMSVIFGFASHFWFNGMQYCGRGMKIVVSHSNNSYHTGLHSENSFLNQANTCLLSLKSMPLVLCHDSAVLQLVVKPKLPSPFELTINVFSLP